MRKTVLKILTLIFSGIMVTAIVAGCAKGDTFDYSYQKESDTMLHFSSSDSDLDAFLNDYLHRHLRYDDYRIGLLSLGDSVMFNKEWEALSLFYFDSTGRAVPDDRVLMMEKYLNNIPVDRFGYTWQSLDQIEGTTDAPNEKFGQGWPFPSYISSQGFSDGWEFNDDTRNWTVEVDGLPARDAAITGGVYKTELTDAKTVTFQSPEGIHISALHSPFLEIDFRLNDYSCLGEDSAFDNIYIYWKREGDSDWDESRKVDYNSFNTLKGNPIISSWNKRVYFPMFIDQEWGTKEDEYIEQLKIVIQTKEDRTVTGNAGLNYVRSMYDTRHSQNSALLLRAAKLHYEFTGKADILERNLPRYRATMEFLLSNLDGRTGLIDLSKLIGHDGGEFSDLGHSIGNDYWDVLTPPRYSMYANVYFYRALKSMEYLEQTAKSLGIEADMPTIDAQKDDGTTYTYKETPESLAALAEKVKTELQKPVDHASKTGFFDEEKGRFILGFDMHGNVNDYGYVALNLELLSDGIATEKQAKQVMSWINGDRIVASDIAGGIRQGATGKVGTVVKEDGTIDLYDETLTFGIYDFGFAPRSTTIHNMYHYSMGIGFGSYPYGTFQVQNGGAIMYVSYYDLMSRFLVNGKDDAFSRLKEINVWYDKVFDHAQSVGVGTDIPNDRFYREYYEAMGVPLQGGGTSGILGLDTEFLESALPLASIPYGFFGLGSNEVHMLDIAPNLPSDLDWWKMENLSYCGVVYDLTIGENFVQIDGVRGATDDLKINVKFDKPDGSFAIYVDGVKTQYSEKDGKVCVQVPFRSCKVTIG